MRRISFVVIVLAAMAGVAGAQTPYGSTPNNSTPYGMLSVPPSSVVSPGVGIPTNSLTNPPTTPPPPNLQLPATTSSSAYDNSLPPTAQPNTLGGITTQSNPNPTVGGLPTTTTP